MENAVTSDVEQPVDPGSAWRELLKLPADYAHTCDSERELAQIRRLGFAWWRVLRIVRLPRQARVFEFGCGGGKHLATLALHGFAVHGVDISPDVVSRAQAYLASIQRFAPISATVQTADFLELEPEDLRGSFDLVFHAGVVEHFLDPGQRALIWRKMVSLARPGGWVVSLVPAGTHPLRQRLRDEKIGGYNVPEIDYDCALHEREFEAAGLTEVRCLAHNFLAYLPVSRTPLLRSRLVTPLRMGANLVLPFAPLPEAWKARLASTLICVGRVRL